MTTTNDNGDVYMPIHRTMPTALNIMEANLIREADAAFVNGDKTALRQLESVSKLVRHVKKLTELFDNYPEIKGNFYRTLTNERCADRHGMLDPEMLADSCLLDNGRHDDGVAAVGSVFSLGALDVLPAEILQDILVERLDLATLTLLRRVSRSLRNTIDVLPHYKAIITHAPGALRAALSLEVASTYTCRALYNTLCLSLCFCCQKFGAYLYVPMCWRVCYQCFTEENAFLAMTKEHAKVHWSITSRDINNAGIQVARSIPGIYSSAHYTRAPQRTRLQLVNYFDACDVSLAVHKSDDRIADVGEELDRQKFLRWQERLRVWQNTPADQRPRSRPALPRYFDWQDEEICNPNRFMCVIPFPWYNREEKVLQWGVACNGCRLPRGFNNGMPREEFLEGVKKQQVLFSKEQYLGHFLSCSEALKIFSEKYESDIVCEAKLFPWWHSICHVVGDYSQREQHPRDAVKAVIDASHRADYCSMVRDRLRKRRRRGRASTAGN